MIGKLSLTPETMRKPFDGDKSLRDAEKYRRQLREAIQEHWHPTLADDHDLKSFLAEVKNLGDEGPLWQTLFAKLPPKFIGKPPESLLVSLVPATVAQWRKKTDLIVLSPPEARELGVPVNEEAFTIEGVKVVVGHALGRHELHRELVAGARLRIGDPGAPPDRTAFWERWLRPLALHYGHIVIRDPYIGADLVRQHRGSVGWFGATTHQTSDDASKVALRPHEMVWLLARLANATLRNEHAQGVLTIETARERQRGANILSRTDRQALKTEQRPRPRLSHADCQRALEEAWQLVLKHQESLKVSYLNGIKELRLVTFPKKKENLAQDSRHDRWIAFSGAPNQLVRYLLISPGLEALRLEALQPGWHIVYRSTFEHPSKAWENETGEMDDVNAAGSEVIESRSTLEGGFADWTIRRGEHNTGFGP